MGLNYEIMAKMSTRMNLMSILNVKDESKVQNILDFLFVPLFRAQNGLEWNSRLDEMPFQRWLEKANKIIAEQSHNIWL